MKRSANGGPIANTAIAAASPTITSIMSMLAVPVTNSSGVSDRPWAFHLRNPLIALFQRQVTLSLMAALPRPETPPS